MERDRKQVIRLCAEAQGIPFNRLDLLIPNAPNTSGVYQGAPPKEPRALSRPQNARDMLNNLGNRPEIIKAFHKQMVKTSPQIKVPVASANIAQQSYLNTAMSFGKGLAQNIFVGNSALGLVSPDGSVITDDDERFDPELVKDDPFEYSALDEVARPEDFTKTREAPELLAQPVEEFEEEEEIIEPVESKSQRKKKKYKLKIMEERGIDIPEPSVEKFEEDRPSPLDLRFSGGTVGRGKMGRPAGYSRLYRDPQTGKRIPLFKQEQTLGGTDYEFMLGREESGF